MGTKEEDPVIRSIDAQILLSRVSRRAELIKRAKGIHGRWRVMLAVIPLAALLYFLPWESENIRCLVAAVSMSLCSTSVLIGLLGSRLDALVELIEATDKEADQRNVPRQEA